MALAPYRETETAASRVLYINSKDATTFFNNNQSDFTFTLEEPIVVPEHHSFLLSVYSAEIPYSFYNFRIGVNCRLDYAVTAYGVGATYDANGFLDISGGVGATLNLPEGNYNAVELAKYLTENIESAGPVFPLEVKFDSISLKFKFRCLIAGLRITLALKHGAATGTPESPGEDMNEELGFDFINLFGDPFFERDPAGLQEYYYGYSQPPVALPGAGVVVNPPGRSGPFLVTPSYYMFSDDCVDMTNSIRSLFLRTNLSTTSVLDSHIGGGFSNILTRVPINTEPGGVISVRPVDGDVHKLLLKVKAITDISITLTNQENQVINLNGLTFDISLKLEFIADVELLPAPNRRLDFATGRQQRQQLQQTIQQQPSAKQTTKKKKTKKSGKKKSSS
tara:strand:+ start:2489 stop:3670 length:1182 start_codon:yes stop_codon:yes gene_type:complete